MHTYILWFLDSDSDKILSILDLPRNALTHEAIDFHESGVQSSIQHSITEEELVAMKLSVSYLQIYKKEWFISGY